MDNLKSCKTFLTFIKCLKSTWDRCQLQAKMKELPPHVAFYESFQIWSTAPYAGVNYNPQVRDYELALGRMSHFMKAFRYALQHLMPESTISPKSGTMNLATGSQVEKSLPPHLFSSSKVYFVSPQWITQVKLMSRRNVQIQCILSPLLSNQSAV